MFTKTTLALLSGALLSPCILAETNTQDSLDPRQLVEMPAPAQQLMRQDMLSHLAALNSIIAALGSGDLNLAADTAEQQMGRASMGKHRASGMGPGRFMPLEMRNLGWGMHDAADAFAVEARKGNAQSAYAALQNVTSSCVACHAVYRTR
ncbi:MAG: cytochrome c [Gammaproteobacteria bacterium]|nr:cytochrome c [Gammaproteobacteria bacterium]